MQGSNIEWCDASWNIVRGCSRVSEGCRNCYAERLAARFQKPGMPYSGLIAKGGQWNGRVVLVDHKILEPLAWKKPAKIFVNSMSDLFHGEVPLEFIDQVFAVMAACPQHIFQVLTKRPERMALYLNSHDRVDRIARAAKTMSLFCAASSLEQMRADGYLPNVWLGVSAEDQITANDRLWMMIQLPAAVRWLSAEPLLGAIDFEEPGNTGNLATGVHLQTNVHSEVFPGLDWVVVGGESGPRARPMHPNWVRGLRDQCIAAGIPFFFKQWGEWMPRADLMAGGEKNFAASGPQSKRRPDVLRLGEHAKKVHTCENGTADKGGDIFMQRVGKKHAGRLLDGLTWLQFPDTAKKSGYANR